MKWYEQAIPRIKDALPSIKDMALQIKACKFVENVYAWNSFADNYDKQDERLKQFDLLIQTKINSGDLLAIDTKETKIFKMSSENLEDMGYNPHAVMFTKNLLQMKPAFIDFYALGKDKKVLHLGPITETLEEYKSIQKEAESKTIELTGFSELSFDNLTSSQRKKWQQVYDEYLKKYTSGCPQGWYAVHNNVEKVMLNTKTIT